MLKTLTYSEVYLLFPVYPLLPIKELLKKQRNGDNKLAGLWMTAISSRRMWRYSLGNDFSSPNWEKNEYSMQKYKGFQDCKSYEGKIWTTFCSLFYDL